MRNIRDLMFIVNSPLLDELSYKDMAHLVLDPEIDLFNTVLNELKTWNDNPEQIWETNFFAAKYLRHWLGYELSVSLNEVFNFEDREDIYLILKFSLFEDLSREGYFHLIERTNLIQTLLTTIKKGEDAEADCAYWLLTLLKSSSPYLLTQKLIQIFGFEINIEDYYLSSAQNRS